jgi:DNA-directed RNA polymerase specialized sigma24 family protein
MLFGLPVATGQRSAASNKDGTFMPTDSAFVELLNRVRAGDEEAAAVLVRQYEPTIRREVRVRLTDPRMYRVFDSMDICQSVMRSFFVRAAVGQYELNHPKDLCTLLMTMARNKVVSQVRKLHRSGRDKLLVGQDGQARLAMVVDGNPGPERIISGQDLLRQVRHHLSEEEKRLADLRARGSSWPEVAAELGGTAEARRKQLARALNAVMSHLGLDDER